MRLRLKEVKLLSGHNTISFNQLAEWTEFDSSDEENLVNDYFDCLIECDDNQQTCKRVCKDLLITNTKA